MIKTLSDRLAIKDLLSGDTQLTSPPNIYFELQKVIDDATKSLADAGAIIENDPALTMRLLKIVNSAFFGLSGQVTTIKQAISFIGFKELQSLALATVIIDKFSSMPGGLLSMHDFWAQSLRCALLSKELCRHQKNQLNLDALFICGLLHDIGQLVFYRRIPVLAREVGLLVEATGIDQIVAETNVIGFDHYQLGAELARLWNLPEIIAATIGAHNNPDNDGAFAEAATIVRAANQLSKLEIQNGLLLNISADALSQIIDLIDDQFDEIFQTFYPN
jgi:putative nucleotidyltransferase with HDIG domain